MTIEHAKRNAAFVDGQHLEHHTVPQLEAEAKKRQQATQLAGRDAEGKPARSSVPPEVEGPKDSGEAAALAAAPERLEGA